MKAILTAIILLTLVFSFSSCGDDDDPVNITNRIMEMKLVDVSRQDTITYTFSYQEGRLMEATVSGDNTETYTASYDSNNKLEEAGGKRFIWEGDQLVRVINENGIWIDLVYGDGSLASGEIKQIDDFSNIITTLASLTMTNNGSNLGTLQNFNISSSTLVTHGFTNFDGRVNMFRAIWWFHFVGEGLEAFRTGLIPDALFMINNPGAYTYAIPSQAFERMIAYTYTYDEYDRVSLVEYTLGGDEYELFVNY